MSRSGEAATGGAEAERPGRRQQRQRTRKDLLRAAARLMEAGRNPTLEEVAEEALVSRATAYRYFPGVEPLLVEAALDLAFPDAESLFAGDDSAEPVARLARAEAAVDAMVRNHEAALRTMLAYSLQREPAAEGELLRQNRRTPLIEAALAPAREQFDPAALALLTNALALIFGTEARLVFKDVLRLEDPAASRVKAWMIRALVEAARKR